MSKIECLKQVKQKLEKTNNKKVVKHIEKRIKIIESRECVCSIVEYIVTIRDI